ncbi:MAG: UDP-3-O-acyl-N-acetylglucosamine deacetylase, partial [candidate division WOR-3 bacterium]
MGKVRFTGSCLNGGESVVEIENSNEFGLYLHEDSTPPVKIPYDIERVHINNHSVTVGTQKQLHVVEHLFSALFGLNLYGVRVDVYGNEIPFFDGSSQDFARALEELAYDRGRSLRSTRCVEVVAAEGIISYSPLETDDLIVDMSLDHPHIGAQN